MASPVRVAPSLGSWHAPHIVAVARGTRHEPARPTRCFTAPPPPPSRGADFSRPRRAAASSPPDGGPLAHAAPTAVGAAARGTRHEPARPTRRFTAPPPAPSRGADFSRPSQSSSPGPAHGEPRPSRSVLRQLGTRHTLWRAPLGMGAQLRNFTAQSLGLPPKRLTPLKGFIKRSLGAPTVGVTAFFFALK